MCKTPVEVQCITSAGCLNYPGRTPVSKLASWFATALQVPELKAQLAVQGLYLVGTCGAEFSAYIRKQYDDYGRAIRQANIRAE
jgi:tripartite-type tricarboxylate transporter receptor subunit TctC